MEDYVFFKTKDPETIELIRVLVKQGKVTQVLNDGESKSNVEIAEAIKQILGLFSVKTQWVAVYRILVDYYAFPKGYKAFCKCVKNMMSDYKGTFAFDYQAIQKGIGNGILTKPYEEWKAYKHKNTDKTFQRQLHIAEALLRSLSQAKCTMNIL